MIPATPSSFMIYLATKKGLTLTWPFPAAYFLDWIMTLTQSTGWITEVAMHPEMDPTRKGLAMAESKLSLGLAASVVEAMFIIYLNLSEEIFSHYVIPYNIKPCT